MLEMTGFGCVCYGWMIFFSSFSPHEHSERGLRFLSSFLILDLRPDNGGVKNSLPEGRGATHRPFTVIDQLTMLVSQSLPEGRRATHVPSQLVTS